MEIRIAESKDIKAIAKFNQAMALETEDKQLPDDKIIPGVTRLIESQSAGFYLVALDGDRWLGCLGITSEWSDWRNGQFWWIQSVYIDQAARRQGVFSALYGRVRKMAKIDKDVCGIRLYVERENHSAQQTYLALGMVETHYRIMEEEF